MGLGGCVLELGRQSYTSTALLHVVHQPEWKSARGLFYKRGRCLVIPLQQYVSVHLAALRNHAATTLGHVHLVTEALFITW